MSRWIIAAVLILNAFLTAMAEDKKPAAFPDDEPPVGAIVDPKDVDLKKLKKELGAKAVAWDAKTGVLTLKYDFRKGQEKDWEIPERVEPAKSIRGIRLGPADQMVHKVPFTAGKCRFTSAFSKSEDTGDVVAVLPGVRVRRWELHGVRFQLEDKEVNIGRPANGQPLHILLTVEKGPDSTLLLEVDGRQTATPRRNTDAFTITLCGGNNGHEFGDLEICGTPAEAWLVPFKK